MKPRPRCTRDADLWHMHAIDHIADPLSSTDDDGRPELSAPTLIRCMPSRDMYRVEKIWCSCPAEIAPEAIHIQVDVDARCDAVGAATPWELGTRHIERCKSYLAGQRSYKET